MAQQIDRDVRHDIGGDEQRVHFIKTNHSAITFKHIMLPVYVAAYRFHQKVFQVLVNARTGEVQGSRPYSWLKITFAVLAVIALICCFGLLAPHRSN